MDERSSEPICLTELSPGSWARLVSVSDGERERVLQALGLSRRWPFQLCQAGSPWIVRVQRTRIGLSDEVASSILVQPEPSPQSA